MESKVIREAFFSFLKTKNHQIVDSAPMVLKSDPTLMFTNAGMNQFKDIFLGNEQTKYKRVADTQKCLRVSGKHNDLEEVGLDTYHHTMFEMLGNWSFGDYFKNEAISFAWEFIVDIMKVDKNRLYATIFEGDAKDNVPKDEDAQKCWEQFLPKDRILTGNKKDNFWEMGETGPCGPCSELHIDLRDDAERKKIDGAELVNKDHNLVIEIWNLVFIQFNRKADGSLTELPAKHVDTGMGFERLCMVVQGKTSNYDTDLFQGIIAKIAKLSNKKYGEDKKSDIAMRVIADHLRAVAFAIADGQLPSNNKAGYVIRRILRRAVRYGYTFLDFNNAFIYELVEELVKSLGYHFSELKSQQKLIEEVIKEEEEAFLRTLSKGLNLINELIANNKSNIISGKDAFTLYDTFGFPFDLTQLISKENGCSVDGVVFNAELQKQKERSKASASQETSDWTELLQTTDIEFAGYDHTTITSSIVKYRKVSQKGKELYHIVLDKTPFYAESGGQVGDTGYIEANNEKISILDTQKENNLIIHLVKKLPKNPNDKFNAVVNIERRTLIARNHTATHLLDHALIEVLGKHVEQKGSYVNEEYIRFDFSHFHKLDDKVLQTIEQNINEQIRNNSVRQEYREVSFDEAQKMGAIALFGEKYGDSVRVIQYGKSIELCGGTHANSTGEIGFVKITSESSISAGVRRIEMVTGIKAEEYCQNFQDEIGELKNLIKSNNLPKSIEDMQEELRYLKAKIESFEQKEALEIKKKLIGGAKSINDIKLISSHLANDSLTGQQLKDICFQLKSEVENSAIVLGILNEGKPTIYISFHDNLVKINKLHAGNIVRDVSKEINGGGGGQPFFASAGGKNPSGIDKALARAVELISSACP
ncbi:MAG: alanine--tRNA ligase [Bacteroidales bacterium]